MTFVLAKTANERESSVANKSYGAPRPRPKDNSNYVIAGAVIATLIGGYIVNLFSVGQRFEMLADKPYVANYVDNRFSEARQYTDQRTAQTLKDAFEHSDANKQAMLIRLEQINSETHTTQGVVTTKIDQLISDVRRLSDLAWDSKQTPRSKQR